MPWRFLVMGLAPFRDDFEFFEKDKFFRDAPLPTAEDGCATPVFKFFEDFLELGILVFFMRANTGS